MALILTEMHSDGIGSSAAACLRPGGSTEEDPQEVSGPARWGQSRALAIGNEGSLGAMLKMT